MKVTLDLDRLQAEGRLSAEECARLRELGAQATGALGFSILIGFGVVAVSGAALALVPSAQTAIVLGLLVGGVAAGLARSLPQQWQLLCSTCLLVGALMLGGGILASMRGGVAAYLLTAGAFAIGAALTQSALLAVLAVLVTSPALGTGNAYSHAAYYLVVERPLATILAYSAAGIGAYALSRAVPASYRRLLLAVAGASAFLVNFGFWVGSLWGNGRDASDHLPDLAFAVAWAVALAATGAWAWIRHKRWLLNVTAVFAGIHFYTQWFEHLHASPGSVLVAGVLALAGAFALRQANSSMKDAA